MNKGVTEQFYCNNREVEKGNVGMCCVQSCQLTNGWLLKSNIL